MHYITIFHHWNVSLAPYVLLLGGLVFCVLFQGDSPTQVCQGVATVCAQETMAAGMKHSGADSSAVY